MPRLTRIDDVLFPVKEHPVFVSIRTELGEQRLSVPDKKAIVNTKINREEDMGVRPTQLTDVFL